MTAPEPAPAASAPDPRVVVVDVTIAAPIEQVWQRCATPRCWRSGSGGTTTSWPRRSR